jgi:outer membrane protein TolC
MRLPITLSLLLAATTSLWAEAPAVQGTMPEDYLPGLAPLLKEAVERSPTTIAASVSVAQAEAGRYLDAAELWPQLGLNANYAVSVQSQTGGPASPPNKGFFYSANISQPLFQWGAYKNQALIGNLGEKIAERQFAEAYRILAVSIREQYMALIGKKIQLRNARFDLKLSREALDVQQARFEAGATSEAEIGNYRLSVEEAQLRADRAEEDYGYAKRVFTRLLGIDELSDDSIPIELKHPEFSPALADSVLTGFVGDGIESTFQSEVYKMTVRQQDLNYSIAKVRLLPKIAATAGISYQNQTQIEGPKVNQIGIQTENYSVGANWNIFDGFATRGAKLSALASKRLAERTRQTYIDQTIDQVSDMRKQVGFSSRAMRLAEVHNALIADEVKRLGDDKSLGYASQATIDSGIVTLYATEFNMAYARSDYFSRWTEFISIAGIDPALANLQSRYVR